MRHIATACIEVLQVDCLRYNGMPFPGRRRVPAAINARLDHDMLFPVELMLTDRRRDIERRSLTSASKPTSLMQLVNSSGAGERNSPLARTRLGCLRSGPVA